MYTKEILFNLLDDSYRRNISTLTNLEAWDKILEKLNSGEVFTPSIKDIFRAFRLCPFDRIRAVLLTQDPYHGPNQADGLCLSVREGCKIPPSLSNVFKELQEEYAIEKSPSSGSLKKWTEEGVLLLNTILTVSPGRPLSHAGIWEPITSTILQHIAKKCKDVIFVTLGKNASEMCSKLKINYMAFPHPSPLNTSSPFLGCGIFREVNKRLISKNILPIRWHRIFDED